MEYILMRHADDSGLTDTYCKIRDIASKKGAALGHVDILERLVSLAIDPDGSYVHDEVVEIVREREEQFRKYIEKARKHGHQGIIGIIRVAQNVLAETIGRINQMVANQPVTVAYNDALRTEFTARAVAKITGGNLVVGDLKEANDVYQWMQDHSKDDGLSVIVTHEPAILRLLPIVRELKYSSAYFVGDVANVGKTFQQI